MQEGDISMTKLKRVLAVTAVAAVVAGVVPATAGASAEVAAAPCQVKSLVTGLQEWYQEVLVTGHSAPPGATHTDLWCGIVRDGETVALIPDGMTGPVAAIAEMTSVHAGTIGSCYVLRVIYIEGTSYADTCP
jgi:hypothetical protein